MGEWETVDLVDVLTELALLCRAGGRHAEAEAHYRRALAILESSVEPCHPSRARIRHHYAALLAELGRDAEAAQLEAGR
jgi:tetratricopeptide (TPR) repeat protein